MTGQHFMTAFVWKEEMSAGKWRRKSKMKTREKESNRGNFGRK
jgi:hypothetical protein